MSEMNNTEKETLIRHIDRIECHAAAIPYLRSERLRNVLYKFVHDITVCCEDFKHDLRPEAKDV